MKHLNISPKGYPVVIIPFIQINHPSTLQILMNTWMYLQTSVLTHWLISIFCDHYHTVLISESLKCTFISFRASLPLLLKISGLICVLLFQVNYIFFFVCQVSKNISLGFWLYLHNIFYHLTISNPSKNMTFYIYICMPIIISPF